MERWVEISFDCLPLRSVTRFDIPLDASPAHRALCERIKEAMARHGAHNTYYLYHAQCVYHLTNSDEVGLVHFRFEGVLFTDDQDRQARAAHLHVELDAETCDWLTQPVVEWFRQTVHRAVLVEFDRYIAAGDLQRTKERLQQMESQYEESGGYMGMYL